MGTSEPSLVSNTYQLLISNLNDKGNANSITLTYNSSTGSQSSVNGDALPFSCTLDGFSFTKEIYQPCQICFTLLLDWGTSTPKIQTIYDTFGHGQLQLTQGAENSAFHLADNYYIFNIQLQRSKSGSQMYVRFEAYSPDKFLTLDKYCKAYTGRKFLADIVADRNNWPDNVPLLTGQTDLSQLLALNPRFMTFVVKRAAPASASGGSQGQNASSSSATEEVEVTYEYIQPYLVQYNESFFDFIVRVTNRCGEFFYYEGGQFHIGLKTPDTSSVSSEAIVIDNYTTINFSHRQSSAWAENTFTEVHQSYTQNKNLLSVGNASLRRDSHIANDDLLYPIPPKDQYSSWKDYALWPQAFWISTVADALNEANLADILTEIVYQPIDTRISSQLSSDSANSSYKKSNFGGTYLAERIYDANAANSSSNSTDDKRDDQTTTDEVDDKYGIYLFSSTPNGKDTVAYSLNFYADIQKGIEQAEQSRIHVVLENYFYPISLGSIVHFGDANDLYIVVKINGTVKGAVRTATVNDPGESFEFEAISYQEGKIYPPSAHVEPIRLSNPQRATITHNSDPLKLGRVRVCYPWQGDKGDPSPWIRMAQPMASKDSGFKFLPEKGDEAMINYENGNIEKPYVEGMLYSMQRPPAYGLKGSGTRVFSSLNGHSIIFSDPGASTNLFKPFSSLWGTLATYIPQLKHEITDDSFQKAMGGIQLTDEYGLYSISMSSEKRSVTIDSPLGKVNLSAFTGITIEAPNGNVKIVGKNVDIVAGNNLTLTSGKNRDFFPKSATSAAVKVAENVIGNFTLIDFATIRTIMETFLRPIAGTLRLSSKRYLCIEAGKGATQILGRKAVQNFNLKKTLKENAIGKSIFGSYVIDRNAASTIYTSKIHEALDTIYQGLTNLFSEYRTMSVNILAVYEAYDNAYKDLHTLTVDLADYLTDTSFPDASTLFKKIQNDEAPQPVDMKADLPADAQPQTVITIRDTLQALNTSATRLHALRYVESEQLNAKLPNLIVVSDHTFTQLVHEMCTPVLPAELVGKDVTANAVSRLEIDKSKFRHAMYEALQYLVGHQMKEDGANYSDGISKSGIGKIASFDGSENWSKFVDDLSKESAVGSVAKDLVKAFVGIDKLDGMVDQYIWDTADHGKILISDEKGKTLHIDQGALNTYMESRQNEDDVDHVIDEIKQVLHRLD